MSWNYRVIEHHDTDGNPYYQIHEVYYDPSDVISWSVDAIEPLGESVEDLREDLEAMLAAFHKPVLRLTLNEKQEETLRDTDS